MSTLPDNVDPPRGPVLVVGAGGLGCPALLELARAGVRALTVADPDRVETTNLHRQLWHHAADVGRLKVESAKEKLERVFPHVTVRALPERVEPPQVDALFREHAVIVDGTDGVETKFMLADAAVRTGRPLVHGGVLRMTGQAMLLQPGGPCLRCLFESPPSRDEAPTCAQAGVLGTMVGIIGSLQARLALQALQGRGTHGAPSASSSDEALMHTFDGATLRGRSVRVRRREDCAGCRDAGAWRRAA